MKVLKLFMVCLVFAGAALFLGACNRGNDADPAPPADDVVPVETPAPPDVDNDDDTEEYPEYGLRIDISLVSDPGAWDIINNARTKVPMQVINTNAAIEGGTLRVGVASNSTFAGVLDRLFTQTTLDADAADLMFFPTFTIGSDLLHANTGIFRVDEWCHDTRSILIVQQYEVNWHDGVPLTLDDLVFAYEVISHRDYTGIRWTESVWNIVGTRAFRDGEADYISGLVLSDDHRSLRMYFESWHPALLFVGAFWGNPSPRHHLEHIPVGDLAAHENVRGNTLGYGPFILESQVPGESKVFVRNPDFFLGETGVERIIYQIIPPGNVPMEIQSGNFDIVTSHPISMWYDDPINYQFVGRVGPNVSWWYSFHLGTYCADTNRITLREDANMACIYLRRAISMAFPLTDIGQALFNGLSFPSINTMNLQHSAFFVPDTNMHTFNPEEARRILDIAGYEVGPDGFRTRPDGSPLVVYLLWQQPGSPAAEMNLEMHLQSARDIGINMQLYQGRAHDFQVFVELSNYQGPVGWDIVSWGWGGGNNPDPAAIWGHTSVNRSRYTSERWDAIFDILLNDPRMWDPEFMIYMYQQWQHAWYESVAAFVGTSSVQLFGVNNRVRNFSTQPPSDVNGDFRVPAHWNWWLVQLTADEPYRP